MNALRMRLFGALTVASVAGLGSETIARADEREQCASAADQAQQMRDEGKYRRAREQMLVCARDACPTPIKRDCLEWLSQLESTAPSIVLSARDASKDLSEVKVSVDGVLVTEKLDGKPVPMDLGKHTVKFEYGGETKEEDVIVGAGQKNRNVSVTFGRASAAAQPSAPGQPTPSPKEGSFTPAIVAGAIGVAALVPFAIFGLSGKGDVDDLQSCKGHCAQSDVNSAHGKLVTADVFLGVSVVAFGVATYLLVTRSKGESVTKRALAAPHPSRSSALSFDKLSFDVEPVAGGAAGSIGARF